LGTAGFETAIAVLPKTPHLIYLVHRDHDHTWATVGQ
jgi:hypothetical protein